MGWCEMRGSVVGSCCLYMDSERIQRAAVIWCEMGSVVGRCCLYMSNDRFQTAKLGGG